MFMHFDESMQIIEDQKITHYKTKKLYLMESLGYVLAEDIIADHNSPAFPTSAMDGYAFKHEDIALGRLRIASINPAGSELKEEV
ncbi:MAG: molybdopterin molybdenumtransferase MoeA, partial [Campylobacterales bacterium]|nr:molybdopterin molybdenumtransferase MoeA [Campylobacterales bacterium]